MTLSFEDFQQATMPATEGSVQQFSTDGQAVICAAEQVVTAAEDAELIERDTLRVVNAVEESPAGIEIAERAIGWTKIQHHLGQLLTSSGIEWSGDVVGYDAHINPRGMAFDVVTHGPDSDKTVTHHLGALINDSYRPLPESIISLGGKKAITNEKRERAVRRPWLGIIRVQDPNDVD